MDMGMSQEDVDDITLSSFFLAFFVCYTLSRLKMLNT